ncbi:MAG TPA: hypothetical protein VEJ18_20865 [Planctomycetota bacterium]|nr:hypothetical protein [Planctomycetota bacterium]
MWRPFLLSAVVLMLPAARPDDSAATYPRIAMLWEPAEGAGDRLEAWARCGVSIVGPGALDLRWVRTPYRDLAVTIEPASVEGARARLADVHARNPRAVVCVEVNFFEARENAYPPDSPWWQRDASGNKVRFWRGCYNLDTGNPEYVDHVAARAEAVVKALDGRAGLFLDNLRFDDRAKAGWTRLLDEIRRRCGEVPILVNAGWASDDLDWIAPRVNGLLYEDAIAHTRDGDAEAFYARVQAQALKCRSPRIGVVEKFGPPGDGELMARELERTLVYTDLHYVYAESTDGHRTRWPAAWSAPLGKARTPAVVPAPGKLARRDFEGGTVLWLPSTAPAALVLPLDPPMTPVGSTEALPEVRIAPGTGWILLVTR